MRFKKGVVLSKRTEVVHQIRVRNGECSVRKTKRHNNQSHVLASLKNVNQSKAQVSIYILMGIILLIGIGVYFFLTHSKIDAQDSTKSSLNALRTGSIERSLDIYISECVGNSLEPLLQQMAIQGGTLQRTDFSILYNREEYRILCEADSLSKDCVQVPLLRQTMEAELEEALKTSIPNCVITSPFTDLGFSVQKSAITAISVKMRDDVIDVSLEMPVTLSKENAQTTKDSFDVSYQTPFGEVYTVVQLILNSHVLANDFDPTQFMLATQTVYEIQKHKPYPNIVYKVKRQKQNQQTYAFLFSLEGRDTVSIIGQPLSITNPHQCCQNPRDGSYFGNVKSCTDNGLIISGACYGSERTQILFIDATSAQSYANILSSENAKLCADGKCNSCANYAHGQSWCSYESVLFSASGSGGLAYVGSRSFRQSCIDGKVYLEDARDYREEICVESQELTIAQIRQNRWQTCASCTTQNCCESQGHDCSWSGWLSTQNKCHPIVPPGFRFWEGGGMQVCAQATTSLRCEGFSCPNKWVDDSSLYCIYQGDCGNYRNVADVITKDGFFNSDPTDVPRSYIYNPNGYNIDAKTAGLQTLKLPLDVGVYNPNVATYPDPAQQLPLLTSAAFSYLDDMSKISPSDFLNPFKKPRIEILDFAFCSQWQAPTTSVSCSDCAKNGFCSEYRCKSLGQTCQYGEFDGIGYCTEKQMQTQQVYITKVSSNTSTVSVGTISAFGSTVYGATLSPTLYAGDPLSFQFETSVPSKCKMSYAPNTSFGRLPSVWIGSGNYETLHSLYLRSPPPILVPKHIYSALEIQSLREVATMAFTLEQTFNQQVQKYDSQLKRYKEMTGIDVVAIARPYVKLAATAMSLYSNRLSDTLEFFDFILAEFEQSTYYIFLKCQDEFGTQSVDYFVSFSLSQTISQQPPKLLAHTLTNTTNTTAQLHVYLDKWSTCRYDYVDVSYDAMQYALLCPQSQYDRSPVSSGSYECQTTVQTNVTQTDGTPLQTLFVLCKDNPAKRKLIQFQMYSQNTFAQRFPGQDYPKTLFRQNAHSRYLVKEDTLIHASDTLLTRNVLYVDDLSINLRLYTDDAYVCEEQMTKQQFYCVESNADDVDRGFYVCDTTLSHQENVSILCGLNPGAQTVMSQSQKFTLR
jgi:hypothetical protein